MLYATAAAEIVAVVVASTPADWEDECQYTLQRVRKVTRRYLEDHKAVEPAPVQALAQNPLDPLMKQIAEVERELELIENALPKIAGEYHATMDPLLARMVEQRREVLRALGAELCSPKWRKRQIQQMVDLCLCIRDLTQERFAISLAEELRFLDVLQLEKEQAAEAHRELQGEPSFDGFDEQDWERWFEHYESNPNYTPPETQRSVPKPHPKKEKAAESPQALSRKLYLDLARELHPDKTTDQDERELRTHLMQRVNAAYEKGDLRSLLHLLQIHGSGLVPEGRQTEALLRENLLTQLAALQKKVNDLLKNLPRIEGNWRALLTKPELWEAYLRKERRAAEQELTRFSHVQHELQARLPAFLRDTRLDDWEELF